MTTAASPSKTLLLVILLSALIISGSLVFLGLQFRSGDASSNAGIDEAVLAKKIEEGIEKYVEKQNQAQLKAREARERAIAEKAKTVRKVSASRDHIKGNPDATVSLIEYSDFECPYCKRFHPTAEKVVAAYGSKVNWVYRHLPLPMHNPGAIRQAEAVECANELRGNDAFWKLTDQIYMRTKSGGKGFPTNKLAPLAAEIGLESEKFQSCLASGKYKGRVQEDIKEANRIGISGTPASILRNNKTGEVRFISGAQPFRVVQEAVNQLLNAP